MSGLEEARRRIEERRAQQKTGGGADLWIRENDLVIAHFLCTGGDNDPLFETYVSHEYPATGQGKYSTLKYCPVESGHDENYDCQGCRDNIKTKDRMIMWFWVYDILHTSLKQGENFPTVMWNNKQYFRREINGPKVWDTSAWRESPLDDILMLGAQLGNLQATRINLMSTGSGLTKRFKLYMEPGTSSIDPTCIATAQDTIRPVIDILKEQLVGVATQANPNAAAQPTGVGGGTITPYTPTGSGAGASSAPAYAPTGITPQPAAKAAPVVKAGKDKKLF